MKVSQCKEWDSQFPEKFNWNLLDSPKLSAIACIFASTIRAESGAPIERRHKTPGLRYALQLIAGTGDV